MAPGIPLHTGKLTQEVKVTVTESMDAHLRRLANLAGCNTSDLVRDALYLQLTGYTYLNHVAEDRRSLIEGQRALMPTLRRLHSLESAMNNSMTWMARQIAQRLAERHGIPAAQTRFNPRPPGQIQTGSATQAVLAYLQSNPGSYFSFYQLMAGTGRTEKSISFAVHYLRKQNLVAAIPDGARNSRYYRYTIVKE